ncbi:MAG: threonine--tRNA ligase [Gammaproteobacteria bacterium]|nr:threonine--tRNA ligase [Gammaproteobacteria bacterium]MYF62151.1 threonine--tRNA ligase [Gammaproteobacteria bacterium]MYI21349.1 threonine--tRNA ligase [Gammaproteobacteria bacterium]
MADESIQVRLPDGSPVETPRGSSAADIAAGIGPGLARAALAAVVNGETVDLAHPVPEDSEVRILTSRDDDALPVLRHSAAHVLATAVRELHPTAGIGFGPAIEDGFYYDFEVDEPFTPEDLEAFEARMRDIVAADHPFERRRISKEEGRELFADDPLKLERLEELEDDEVITVYRDGPFLDLCRGPHVPSTGGVKHFKLLSTAGAYWRGDESRQMLQRIYGTAFFSRKALDEHLERLEEARRRDHRVLGRELDLFSIQEEVGSGLVLWHPNGGLVRHTVEEFLKTTLLEHGYELVYSPHVAREELYRISGHLEVFSEDMFPPMADEGHRFRMKPMNCPHHFMIYRSRSRSYRDLPLRYAELGTCYRYERTGTLHGMLRVRSFTQDDAHIFVREDQISGEYHRMLDLVAYLLGVFGYGFEVALSTRPEKAIGDPAVYDAAVDTLAGVLEERGQAYEIDEGGGAFYGPKVDILLVDALGRKWQGPTFQLDFLMPQRFGLDYVGSDNQRHNVVVIHRTMLGSMERFIGGLVEHYAGAFPVWLAPEQVRVLPVSEVWSESAQELVELLRANGVRAQLDDQDTLGYRIREAEVKKVPYMGVVGKREAEAGTVAVRRRGAGKKQVVMDRKAFAGQVAEDIRTRARW